MTAVTTRKKISFADTSVAFASKSNARLRKMYWLFASMNNSLLVDTGTGALKLALKLNLPVKGLIKYTIFEQFCGGETISDCEPVIRALHQYGVGTILDYSVEGEKSEAGFEATAREIVDTIRKAAGNPAIPFSVFKITGIADTDLLYKVQKGEPLSGAEKAAFEKVKARVDNICREAFSHKVNVFIDGEETWIQGTIDSLAYEMMRKYNRQEAIVWNTYQLYRHDMLGNLQKAFVEAEKEGFYLGAKLVRGAYMEKERGTAEKQGMPDPIQPDKNSTDEDFNAALRFCIAHLDRIRFCAGTHNEQSCYLLTELMEEGNAAPGDRRIWFAQLYGMSDNISYNLAQAGYNVAKYVPYGPVKAVMPYLFRRAAENTSIAGQSSREFRLIEKEMQRRKATRRA
jgi:proline dehydrogenase